MHNEKLNFMYIKIIITTFSPPPGRSFHPRKVAAVAVFAALYGDGGCAV